MGSMRDTTQVLLVHGSRTARDVPTPLQSMALVLADHGFATTVAHAGEVDATRTAGLSPAPLVVAFGMQSVGVVQALNGTQVPVLWWLCDGVTDYAAPLLRQCPGHLFCNITAAAAGSWAAQAFAQRCAQPGVEQLLSPAPRLGKTGEAPSLPKAGEGTVTFALLGPISPAQGQDVLLRAVELLDKDDAQRCRFVFAGEPRHHVLDNMLARAATRDPQRTLVLHHVEPGVFPSLLIQADCVVCAARDSAMPTSVVEACRMGKVVICSNHTSMASLLEEHDAGLVCTSDDARSLAQCMSDVLHAQPTVLQDWRQNARTLYETCLCEEAFWHRLNMLMDLSFARAASLNEELQSVAARLRALETQLLMLVDQEAQASVVILPDYEHTLSWQITKPLRAAKQLLGIRTSAYELLSNLGAKRKDTERDDS